MTQEIQSIFSLTLTPLGHLHLVQHVDVDVDKHDAQVHHPQVIQAFAQSQELGLLQLVSSKIDRRWSQAMKYWRNYIAQYVDKLCHYTSQEYHFIDKIKAPKEDELQRWLLKMPPQPGMEYASTTVLASIWSAFDEWCRVQVVKEPQGVGGFLRRHFPAWRQVGRVCLHLGENKKDPHYPFAFIATFASSLTGSREVNHKPLSKALEDYAGDANKQALHNLLKPLHEASKNCVWLRELIESHDIYRSLAWTPVEAYEFLQSIPQLEMCGLVVRGPNWWKKRAKPRVLVTLGSQKNSVLSTASLLNFTVNMTINGEVLSPEELELISNAETGLLWLRGQYVEIDRGKLNVVLSHWQSVQEEIGSEGVPFIEGMRLLAGVRHDLAGAEFSESMQEWSGVKASDDLANMLEKFRHPETIQAQHLGDELRTTLRPYQQVGVSWLYLLTDLGLGACLADDMGLGKTIQVIALLLIQKKKGLKQPSLLVLPASLLANWKAELQRFAPSLTALFLHGSELSRVDLDSFVQNPEQPLEHLDLVVTSYGMLQRQLWLTTREWRLVILDEAQAIKNPASEQAKLTKKLKAHARIALTGTPIENRLGDLWSLYDFICPGLLGNRTRFKQFIRSVDEGETVSYAPLRQLVQPYLLRRLKTDKSIIADLPDKIEMKVWCSLSKEQLTLYTQAVHDMKKALASADQDIRRKGLVLSYLTRFKQICNHPGQILGDMDYHESRSGKFARLAELVLEIAARQEKVLIFTQYREITVPIAAYLEQLFGTGGLVLHGGTPVAKRQALVDRFQDEQGPPFFVLSLKAGGTGLNLTAASHVIHFDRWWNSAVENQATDRAFRIGQKHNVLVHKFICKGTIEEKIDQLIADKIALAADVLQVNGESLLTEMSDQQLLDLVSLDINQIINDGNSAMK